MLFEYISKRQSIAIILLIALLTSFTFGQGQTVRTKASAPSCSGAWTGTITYTRTQQQSDHKVTPRVSQRGKDTRDWEMRFNYRASVAVIESPERNGSSAGKATIDHSLTSIEKSLAEEENSCDRGKSFQLMSGTFVTRTQTSGQGKGEANVSIGVNTDGTYSIGVGLPPINGEITGSESASYSGQCTKKEGKNLSLPPTSTNIQGNALSSDGTHRLDPRDPNRLSGSFTQTTLGITETLSWSLQKCGAELRITDLQFDEMKFPNWNDWREIAEQKGTIDGNYVKIRAKILNTSGETKYADVRFKETYKGDKWDGARPDSPLKDDVFSVSVEAGEEKEVEMVWDSSGYAWFDDGRPRLLQRIKAEIEVNSKKIDEMTKNLKVAPKPVVLVHGLWSNWHAWEPWQNILTTSHSYDWKAFPVGEKPEHGVMNTGKTFMSSEQTASIGDNGYELEKYVKYAQEDRNAWHVNIVAHSMGGLISRWYIDQLLKKYNEDPRPRVSHLVMLSTPNMGSPCADVMDIAFGMIGKQVEAVRQLMPDYVAGFNRMHTQRKGVKFSSLAGNPLPTMCKEVVWNDGVVSVPSAKWIIKDTAESKSLHTDLTGTKDFSAFVKPHLAIGPKGDHNPEMPTIPGAVSQVRQANSGVTFMNASFQLPFGEAPERSSFDMRPDFAKTVKLSPKQTVEVEIPVEAANDLGLTFMADPQISATLYDETGKIVGKNLTKTPEASQWFRSIYFDGRTNRSTWKLMLENTSDKEHEVILASWKDARK